METIDIKDKVIDIKKEQLGLKAEEPMSEFKRKTMGMTPEQIQEFTRVESFKRMLVYSSRKKLGLCKNEDCYNMRRDGSAYCQDCSDKYKNK